MFHQVFLQQLEQDKLKLNDLSVHIAVFFFKLARHRLKLKV